MRRNLVGQLALPSEAHESKDQKGLASSLGKTACIELQGVSGSYPKLIYQRDDGQYEVGLSGLIGPFPTRPFAESVAREVLIGAS
jgi:hypothetical protein